MKKTYLEMIMELIKEDADECPECEVRVKDIALAFWDSGNPKLEEALLEILEMKIPVLQATALHTLDGCEQTSEEASKIIEAFKKDPLNKPVINLAKRKIYALAA